MQIILQEDVEKLGNRGELVEVRASWGWKLRLEI